MTPEQHPAIHQHEVNVGDRRVIILGTGHIASDTLDAIDRVVDDVRPMHVAVPIDERRMLWLRDREESERRTLVQIIRAGELGLLNSKLTMAILHKRFGSYNGVDSDADIERALEAADRLGVNVALVDRDVEVTCLRAWRLTPQLSRLRLVGMLLLGTFRRSASKDLEEARRAFDAAATLAKTRQAAPVASRVVFDESAAVIADSIRRLDGDVVVVVPDVYSALLRDALAAAPDISTFQAAPPKTWLARAFPWVVSGLTVGAFTLGFLFGDPTQFERAAFAWIVANSTLAGIGTFLAFGHPATVILTAISAPIVSLNPAVGAGMVGALVQAFVAPPSVREMERVGDDIGHWTGWWTNKLARVLLIFVFANLFSTIGSFAAVAWISS